MTPLTDCRNSTNNADKKGVGMCDWWKKDPFCVSGHLKTKLTVSEMIWRGYFLTALALNVAIVTFLLNAGASRNLWDYVMDPVAWFIGCGTWLALAAGFVIERFRPAKSLVPVQPSSGIGETPISH